jgi:choline dehydrogenase
MLSSSHRGRSFWAALAVTLFSGFASVSASGKQCQPVPTYDYIVVGSGPGGGLVASNLALAGHSVLLLEAGADASDDPATSVNALSYPQNPNYQWSFFVKHHADADVEARYRLLTWTLPDGTYWVGPKADAPAGAELNGVWYVLWMRIGGFARMLTRSRYPRGATLGGSAMVNAMASVLPNDADWNKIAKLAGDKSWSYVNAEPMTF